MNPYQVLGVSPGDSEETIKKAYRNAAKKCHPDTHPGDRQAEERFKEIGEAYRILGNSRNRKKYDESAAQQGQNRTGEARKRAAGANPFYPGGFEKEFERFFSAGTRQKENGTKKQQNINPMDVTDLFERYMGFKR